MKKILMFVVASYVLIGCNNFVEQYASQQISDDAPDIIYASFGEDTKTYVEQNKYLRWNAEDEISFFSVTYNMRYQFQGSTGDNNGAFQKLTTDLITGNELNNNYAVYPYKASTTMSDEGVISFVLPEVQNYAENSFGVGANTMVAITSGKEDNILRFKNVCGYLRLSLYGKNAIIKSVELKGNNGEKIAGASTITAIYGRTPEITVTEKGTTTVTLDCGDGVALGTTPETAIEFWLVLPETTFKQGITITVTDIDGNVFEKSTSNGVIIERNTIQPMAALETKFIATKPANDEIWYTSSNGTVVKPYLANAFGANIVSNTYENGKGVIKIDAPVTSIGVSAFKNCSSLTSVTIPGGVTSIGDYAFNGCRSLTSIVIPEGVTSIGLNAFKYCQSLTNITIPNSVTSIGYQAFYYCKSLTNITIPNSTTSIGEGAFSNCKGLIAFYGKFASADNRCLIINSVLNSFAPAGLTSYTIPQNVTSIGGYAFESCSDLRITIPNSVLTIGQRAFHSCSNLTITIPNSVTSIGGFAFSECSGELIVNCDIPSSSSSSFGAFYYSYFTKVTIGNSVTSIGKYAFDSCIYLTSITIPNSATSIGQDAFYGCSSLASVYCKPTTPPSGKLYMFDGNASGRKIYVPRNSVEAYKSDEYWSKYADDIVGYDF